MKSEERRNKLIDILKASKTAVTGKDLSLKLGVSRQVIVQDITVLRAQGHEIISMTNGYLLEDKTKISRVFKVIHSDEDTATELNLIVDYGGNVEDVFIYHKVYGTVRAELGVANRKDVSDYLENLAAGKSSYLKNVTSGYHYHTVSAASEAILDIIQEKLNEKGFLAKLQDYEPVDFWKDDANSGEM